MAQDLNPVIDWIERQLASGEIVPEVLGVFPGLTVSEAYRVQQGLIARRIEGGNRLVGYKAAMTSQAMRDMVGHLEPVLGHLLAAGMLEESQPLAVADFVKPTVEPEVAVILKRGLAGPGVTRAAALAAIDHLRERSTHQFVAAAAAEHLPLGAGAHHDLLLVEHQEGVATVRDQGLGQARRPPPVGDKGNAIAVVHGTHPPMPPRPGFRPEPPLNIN